MSRDRMPWYLTVVVLLSLTVWVQPTAAAPSAACVVQEVDGQAIGQVEVDGDVVFRIRVPAGGIDIEERCRQVASRIEDLLHADETIDPRPDIRDGYVVVRTGDEVLITVTEEAAARNNTRPGYLAWKWANQLRKSLGLQLLDETAVPQESSGNLRTVTASWYGQAFAGRRTASGELFVPEAFTAAHRTLPFNTKLRVINPATGAEAVVRINDRGPWVGGRELDLSWGAAKKIGLVSRGVGPVLIEVIELGDG